MIIPALDAGKVYGPGKGEAIKLETPDMSKPAEQLVQVALETAKVEGALDEKVDLDAWAPSYYDLSEEIETLRADFAKRKAEGELNALQTGAGFQRGVEKVLEKARLTKQQENNWMKTKEVYDKDDKGLYDRTVGYTKLKAYENPNEFVDQKGFEDLKVQLESVGGDVIKWRAKYGSYYLEPELAFDLDAYSKKKYGSLEAETTAEIGNDPLVDGVVTTTRQTASIPNIISAGRQDEQQALNGNFNATRYLQHVQAYIGKELRVDPDGSFNPTPQGRQLIQTMSEIYQVDPEAQTIDFGDGGGPVPLTEQTFQRGLMDAYYVQDGRKYQEEKEQKQITMNRAISRNVVNIGGGTDRKADIGYYTTQKEQFANFVGGEYQTILQEFATPEERNSDAFLNTLYSGLQKALDIDQLEETKDFWSAQINTKVPIQEPNRAENVADLTIQTPQGRKPVAGVTGEVTNLVPQKQTFVLTYLDPSTNQWKIATDNQLKSGAVSLNQTRIGVRYEYNVTKPEKYEAKEKIVDGVKVINSTARPPEWQLYDQTDGGKKHVVRILPFERGVSESLDANIKGASDFGKTRKQGGLNIPGGNILGVGQEVADDAFSE